MDSLQGFNTDINFVNAWNVSDAFDEFFSRPYILQSGTISNIIGNDGRTLLRSLLDMLCSFVRKSITYPYALTSVITSTLGSGLPIRDLTYRAGFGPKYDDWRQVHRALRASGNQWRGQYSFFRSYTGPYRIGFDGHYYAAPILSI
ncbi:unnamed protein product [Toxocara canis]|uniref:Uncharacterized protein n=1 Tax=Toxocara canis TaxID=6265 RepID=A0A183UMH9_TOXCA|nr:unnamed protein product [Toxocara canis]